ncbi:MAG: TIGR03756 family integrating conjugative element protein, partial [Gammaproteobacteria bacterium]|nr:TIGR03756 family integrating conjugative element protein [Gammaproteobacteria bacterium]
MASRFRTLILTSVLLFPVTGNTGTITTPGIVAKTTVGALACMRWMPIGMCFWLRCSWTGCKVKTSLKVGHYNPDLVISSYNELGGNPWLEIRATLGLAQKAVATGLLGALLPVPIDSAGNRTEGTADRRDHKNLLFR